MHQEDSVLAERICHIGQKNGEGRRSCMEKPGREEAKHPKLEVLYTVKVS